MIRFSINKLHLDGPVTNHWEALLRIVGEFSIELNGRLWYSEQEFCVLEFLRALMKWREQLDAAPVDDFEYQSMESAELWLIRLLRLQNGRWRFEARGEEFSESDGVSLAEIDVAVGALVENVASELPERERVIDALRGNPENALLATALTRAGA